MIHVKSMDVSSDDLSGYAVSDRSTMCFLDDPLRWIPKEQPFSRPKPRQVNRHMLLRGLAEQVVYEDSVAQRYAGLLAAVICDGNPVAKREYEHMLAQERQRAKSLVSARQACAA